MSDPSPGPWALDRSGWAQRPDTIRDADNGLVASLPFARDGEHYEANAAVLVSSLALRQAAAPLVAMARAVLDGHPLKSPEDDDHIRAIRPTYGVAKAFIDAYDAGGPKNG